ncbi:GNAT family N-acetyltransferase [Cytobacillus sp. FJAT-54145]|uniref:GNAT family N-acetyltransferase n=1 Tax=Cytobacillus spartinae TaxID=3299023 RepID=A0ABW6K7F9_9BACI
MLTFKKMSKSDTEMVAEFISTLNKLDTHHIGYCGTDAKEIENTLREDITDVPYWESFLIALDHDSFIGVLGFDADIENGSAEIWGPFVKEDYWTIVPEMWREMQSFLPSGIEKLYMFPNKNNISSLEFAKQEGFQIHSEQTILEFEKVDFHHNKKPLEEITEAHYSEFVSLHDHTFPSTYYNGDQIIARLNNHRKVFITKESDVLTGYIYVEAEPEFGEANIEFFAVHEQYRGKGIGGQLLHCALQWIFSFTSINTVTLCVNASNVLAITLYKRVGFTHVHDLVFLTKEMKSGR